MKIDKKLITDGYVSERKHPECDYYVYNYTNKCQIEEHWNEQTLQCRGLILDGEGNVISKPFNKFFNIGEHNKHSDLGDIPYYNYFDKYDKLDGSLGILYALPNGEYRISTRGSFESKQAIIGTEILKEKYSDILPDEDFTYLFEIIYPKNRIVVDYKGQRDLVLLAVIRKSTGEALGYEALLKIADLIGCPMTQYYGRVSYNRHAFLKLEDKILEGTEGFVLVFDNGLRVKIKSDEYVRLHRIVTGASNRSIWDLLRNGQGVAQFLDRVPDDLYSWVAQQESDFLNAYAEIEKECSNIVKFRPDCNSRKELAEYVIKHKYPHILFAMIDEKLYEQLIWKILRPEKYIPFREDI